VFWSIALPIRAGGRRDFSFQAVKSGAFDSSAHSSNRQWRGRDAVFWSIALPIRAGGRRDFAFQTVKSGALDFGERISNRQWRGRDAVSWSLGLTIRTDARRDFAFHAVKSQREPIHCINAVRSPSGAGDFRVRSS
jgi:hypothetical protein